MRQLFVEYRGRDIAQSSLFISAFNIQHSWTHFRRVRLDDSQYAFLDGLRSLSILMVIYTQCTLQRMLSDAHTLSAITAPLDYTAALNHFYAALEQQLSLLYATDTLFWLSGFFSCLSLYKSTALRHNTRQSTLRWICCAYASKLCRIIPIMWIALAVQWQLLGEPFRSRCSDNFNFVRVMFLADNVLDGDHACMTDLWWLQCDAQMFLLAPLCVLLFEWHSVCGFITALLPVLASVAFRLWLALPSGGDLHFADEAYTRSFIVPYSRMAPYFVGVVTLFVFVSVEQAQTSAYKASKGLYAVSLSLGVATMMALLNLSDHDSVWAFTLSRVVWALSLSMVAFALRFMGGYQKSMLKALLSCAVHQSVSRLALALFMAQTLWFSWSFAQAKGAAPRLQSEFVIVTAVGVYGVLIVAALALWMVVQRPMGVLMGRCLSRLNGSAERRNSEVIVDRLGRSLEIQRVKSVEPMTPGGQVNLDAFATDGGRTDTDMMDSESSL